MGICEEDIDCDPLRTNQLCYSNLSNFDASSLDSFGCACNSFYGWTGTDCDQYSFSSWFTIVLFGINSIVCTFLFFELLRIFIIDHRYEEKRDQKYLTIISAAVAALGCWGWSLAILLSTLTIGGDGIIADPENYSDPFSGRWNSLALVFGPCAVMGMSLAVTNVAIFWLDMCNATRNLNRTQTSSYRSNRRALIAVQVLAVVLAGGALAYEKLFDGTSVLGFAIAFPVLLVDFWYVLAYMRFMPILRDAAKFKGNDLVESTRVIVKKTTLRVLLALAIYFGATVTYSVLDSLMGGWKNHSQVGEVGAAKVFHHLQPLSITVALFAIYRYLLLLTLNGGMYILIGHYCNPYLALDPNYERKVAANASPASIASPATPRSRGFENNHPVVSKLETKKSKKTRLSKPAISSFVSDSL